MFRDLLYCVGTFLKVFASCLTQEVMAVRNEHEWLLNEALDNLAQVMANQGGGGGEVVYHGLDCFQRNDPLTFKGGYDPKGVEAWLREIEKIFWVMECQD